MLEFSFPQRQPKLTRATSGVQSSSLSQRKQNMANIDSPALRYMESVKRSDNMRAVQALYDDFEIAKFSPPEGEKTSLPDGDEQQFISDSLPEALQNRHSKREYTEAKINLDQLAHLLKHAVGLSRKRKDFPTRTYPSGGAFYSIKIFLYIRSVDGLEEGFYYYNSFDHSLYRMRDKEKAVGKYVAMYFEANADLVFLLTHDLEKQFTRYEDLSFKISLLEAGHLSQNIVLVATAMGITGTPLLAYDDVRLNTAMELREPFEAIAYAVELGL